MSLATIIHAGMRHYEQPNLALVLMGGGARTAYQVGVLRALGNMLQAQPGRARRFPFQILIGTSAGAINAAFLAAHALEGLQAFEQLAEFWGRLRSSDVYRLTAPRWLAFSRVSLALGLSRHVQARGALLDNTPLAEMLGRGVSLDNIEKALRSRSIDALAVTGSSYTSGVHWTFCQTASREGFQPWTRPGRRAECQPLTIAHLMASSAIPFLFPATPLTVEGRQEHFGDGSMRQITPLSPAMHLGAQKILVIGVGQPERPGFAVAPAGIPGRGPSLGSMAGHVMASVFHDTLQADVEQARRVADTINGLPQEAVSAMNYKAIDVLVMAPTESLDALAQQSTGELPTAIRQALAALGMLKGGGGALASYLLFEQGFIQSLMAMGERDAVARTDELLQLILGN